MTSRHVRDKLGVLNSALSSSQSKKVQDPEFGVRLPTFDALRKESVRNETDQESLKNISASSEVGFPPTLQQPSTPAAKGARNRCKISRRRTSKSSRGGKTSLQKPLSALKKSTLQDESSSLTPTSALPVLTPGSTRVSASPSTSTAFNSTTPSSGTPSSKTPSSRTTSNQQRRRSNSRSKTKNGRSRGPKSRSNSRPNSRPSSRSGGKYGGSSRPSSRNSQPSRVGSIDGEGINNLIDEMMLERAGSFDARYRHTATSLFASPNIASSSPQQHQFSDKKRAGVEIGSSSMNSNRNQEISPQQAHSEIAQALNFSSDEHTAPSDGTLSQNKLRQRRKYSQKSVKTKQKRHSRRRSSDMRTTPIEDLLSPIEMNQIYDLGHDDNDTKIKHHRNDYTNFRQEGGGISDLKLIDYNQYELEHDWRRATVEGAMLGVECPLSHWVRDVDAEHCLREYCENIFNFFLRRHHCRLCGLVFCYQCSSKTVETVDNKRIRACDGCYDQLTEMSQLTHEETEEQSQVSETLGDAHIKRRNLDAALKCYRQAVCLESTPERRAKLDDTKRIRAEEWMKDGRWKQQWGDLVGALESYTYALRLQPCNEQFAIIKDALMEEVKPKTSCVVM